MSNDLIAIIELTKGLDQAELRALYEALGSRLYRLEEQHKQAVKALLG